MPRSARRCSKLHFVTGADHGRLHRTAGRFAVLLVLVALINSCSTTVSQLRTVPAGSPSIAPAATSRWVKIHPDPPTWYPRGTPADHPTDYRSGEWLYTEDAVGSRYFIPVRGIAKERREALRKEALAARSPRKVARIAGEDALRVVGAGAATVLVLTPPGLLALGAMHGIGPGPGGVGSISPGSVSGSCAVSGGCGGVGGGGGGGAGGCAP